METEPSTSPEYDRFKSLLNKLMAVPKDEIVKREKAYRRKADRNPSKRGPKRKVVT